MLCRTIWEVPPVVADSSGTSAATLRYFPFGASRFTTGSIPTDEKFTGQRLDSTGLYYYGARYYDAGMGSFISPDTIIPHPNNPQSFNRYSYALNNPLKYVDPTGHEDINGIDSSLFDTYGFDAVMGMLGATDQFASETSSVYTDYAMANYDGSAVVWNAPETPVDSVPVLTTPPHSASPPSPTVFIGPAPTPSPTVFIGPQPPPGPTWSDDNHSAGISVSWSGTVNGIGPQGSIQLGIFGSDGITRSYGQVTEVLSIGV